MGTRYFLFWYILCQLLLHLKRSITRRWHKAEPMTDTINMCIHSHSTLTKSNSLYNVGSFATTHKTLRGPRGGLILSNAENAKKFNFNKAVFPGIQGGPLMHVIAAKAVCLKEALQPEFKEYARLVVENAKALCAGLQKRGVDIVSGGTDNHLMLVDLKNLGVTGKEMENLLDEVNITCNKNTIPNDPQSPFVTSGVRLGTPAVTSRGMKPEDMDVIAEAISLMLKSRDNKEQAKALVKSLTDKYPLAG